MIQLTLCCLVYSIYLVIPPTVQCQFLGDSEKVKQLDALVTKMAGFEKHYAVTGQTYSRKVDVECLLALSSLGSTVHKVKRSFRSEGDIVLKIQKNFV